MKPIITSSYLISPSFVRQGQLLRQDIQTTAQEMASGLTSDVGKKNRGDFSRLNSINNGLAKIEAYKVNINFFDMTTDAMQSVITGISEKSGKIVNHLMVSSNLVDPVLFATSTRLGSDTFVSAISALNTAVAGRHLFSGVESDKPPFPPAAEIIAELELALPASDDPNVIFAAISDWFMTSGGFDSLYQGGGSRGGVAITADDTVKLGVIGIDPAIRESLIGLAALSLLDNGALEHLSSKIEIAEASLASLAQSRNSMTYLGGVIGSVQEQLTIASVRVNSEETAFKLSKINLLEADVYESTVKLTDLETRLEAFYLLTARLSKLRLSDYI